MSMGIDSFVFNGFGERKLGNITKINKLKLRFIVTLDSPACSVGSWELYWKDTVVPHLVRLV